MEWQVGSVAECIAQAGLTGTQAARRADVSASTVHRILHEQVSPSMATLEEIAAACGATVTVSYQPAHEPLAAAAARDLLDDSYDPHGLPVNQWRLRLERWSGGEPLRIVDEAAAVSGVLHRPGNAYLAGNITPGRLASAGTTSGQQWALSGAAGLSLPGFSDATPAITVLWCQDSRAMRHMLTSAGITDATAPHRATVVIAEAEPELFAGRFELDHIYYAAPLQIVLDGISVGGDTAAVAHRQVQSW